MASKKQKDVKKQKLTKSDSKQKIQKQKDENYRLKEEIKALKKKRDFKDTLTFKMMPYILSFIGIFLAICFIIPDKMSFIGYLSYFLCGFLSAGAPFIPLCLVVEAIYWKRDAEQNRLKSKIVVNAGLIICISVLWQLFAVTSPETGLAGYNFIDLYESGMKYSGGGIIGGYIGNFLEMITGVGAWIICVSLLTLLSFALFNITPLDILLFLKNKIKEAIYNARLKRKEQLKRDIYEKSHPEVQASSGDEDGSVSGSKRKKAYLSGMGDESTDESHEEDNDTPEFPEMEISPDAVRTATDEHISESGEPFSINGNNDGEDSNENASGVSFLAPDNIPQGEKKEINLAEIFTDDAVIASAGVSASTSEVLPDGADIAAAETTEIETDNDFEGEKEDVKVASKPDPAELYRFPDLDFLQKDPNPATFAVTDEIRNTSVRLVETLANFGVKTKIMNICCGPTVTRYELQPEIGVRVKSIQNLADDIALHLAASGVRIEAPIPGKQAVGIEVPNQTVSTVYIRNLIENPKFAQLKSKLSVCLGMDVAGSPVFMDIAKMPHLLIAGATGMGKSVCINSFIVSLLYKARPDECKLLLIDPKKVEFSVYNGMPHLIVPVVSDPKKAAGSLAWAVNEMERRFQLIEEVGVRDIDSFNRVTENDPEKEHMPKIVIIIDELADLMMTARDSVESSICRIAQKARAAGIHLVIGTQRPSVDVITGLIKANVPSRIACTVASQVDSRTILDIAGAEKLLGKGDMLYAPVGCMKPLRVQGSFVGESEIEQIISFLKSGTEVEYDNDIINSIEREAEHCGEKRKKGDAGDSDSYDVDDRDAILDSDDAMFPAIEIAVDANMISTSLLQRKLALGYARASRIVDKLEKIGIVGPYEGSKPRKVLITRQEYLEMKMNHEK